MGALVESWLERLGQAMVPGAAPAVCSLLEDDGSPVPMGPPLAELLAGGVHQQQVEGFRAGLAAAFRLADAYKQARSPPAAAQASAGALPSKNALPSNEHGAEHRDISHCWRQRCWRTAASTSRPWRQHTLPPWTPRRLPRGEQQMLGARALLTPLAGWRAWRASAR